MAHGGDIREKDAPGFERFEDYLIKTIASWLDEMRGIGKPLPHPSANHRAGELNASLATVRGSMRSRSTLARFTDLR